MSAVVTPEHRRKALRVLWTMSFGDRAYPSTLPSVEVVWIETGADPRGEVAGAAPIAQALADEAVAAIRATEKRIAWFLRKWGKQGVETAEAIGDDAGRVARPGYEEVAAAIGISRGPLRDHLLFSSWSLYQAAAAVERGQYGYEWAAAYAMNGGRDPE